MMPFLVRTKKYRYNLMTSPLVNISGGKQIGCWIFNLPNLPRRKKTINKMFQFQ
jgi:hypothetical protein